MKANATSPSGASDEFVNDQVLIRLFGDVNGDGKVNISDVGIVAMAHAWGMYDPNYDLDDDGRINISDVGIVAMQMAFYGG